MVGIVLVNRPCLFVFLFLLQLLLILWYFYDTSHDFNVFDRSLCEDIVLFYDSVYGVSVNAGRSMVSENLIHLSASIPIHTERNVRGTILEDYVSSYPSILPNGTWGIDNATHSLLTTGYHLILNSVATKTATCQPVLIAIQSPSAGTTKHHTTIINTRQLVSQQSPGIINDTIQFAQWKHRDDLTTGAVICKVAQNTVISVGQQIFSSYGPKWVEQRSVGDSSVSSFIPSKRRRLPGCPTLTTELRQGAIYAKKNFVKGEIIQVAVALLLPEDKMQQVSYVLEKLLWWAPIDTKDMSRQTNVNSYAQTHGKSFALWLFGDAVFFQGEKQGSKGNLGVSWWDGGITEPIVLTPSRTNTQIQLSKKAHPMWIRNGCRERMLVAFTANQDIAIGEELTIIDLQTDKNTNKRYKLLC